MVKTGWNMQEKILIMFHCTVYYIAYCVCFIEMQNLEGTRPKCTLKLQFCLYQSFEPDIKWHWLYVYRCQWPWSLVYLQKSCVRHVITDYGKLKIMALGLSWMTYGCANLKPHLAKYFKIWSIDIHETKTPRLKSLQFRFFLREIYKLVSCVVRQIQLNSIKPTCLQETKQALSTV